MMDCRQSLYKIIILLSLSLLFHSHVLHPLTRFDCLFLPELSSSTCILAVLANVLSRDGLKRNSPLTSPIPPQPVKLSTECLALIIWQHLPPMSHILISEMTIRASRESVSVLSEMMMTVWFSYLSSLPPLPFLRIEVDDPVRAVTIQPPPLVVPCLSCSKWRKKSTVSGLSNRRIMIYGELLFLFIRKMKPNQHLRSTQ